MHRARRLHAAARGHPRSDVGSAARVTAAADPAELAALDALLERVAEAHRPPVLAPEGLADLVARELTAVLEQVLDQRQLAAEPPVGLVGIARRGAREGGVGAHRSLSTGRCWASRSKRGAFCVPRPWPRPTV